MTVISRNSNKVKDLIVEHLVLDHLHQLQRQTAGNRLKKLELCVHQAIHHNNNNNKRNNNNCSSNSSNCNNNSSNYRVQHRLAVCHYRCHRCHLSNSNNRCRYHTTGSRRCMAVRGRGQQLDHLPVQCQCVVATIHRLHIHNRSRRIHIRGTAIRSHTSHQCIQE
ncbi:unnamed protein product [Gongylonema pulchrum]|uniref:Uncharacterized protein n=1 Tax=Gongylonema pulchrum TaxID=637853 RepID=A0A3P7RAJ3_9BILA|nr:unnamed protein product [Gongylonema pulchrum]